jgi:S1-C subfamily serine protease
LALFGLGISTATFLGNAPAARESCPETPGNVLARLDPCADSVLDSGPASIKDKEMMGRLLSEASALLDQRQCTDIDQLVKQLELDRCSLEPAPPRAAPRDASDLYASARHSVVTIGGIYKCDRCDKWHASTATGFVISADGAIVTNYHVVDAEERETLVVMTADGYVTPVKRVLAASEPDDLAILKVDMQGLAPLPLYGEAPDPPVGTAISVISHPAGHFYSFTTGIISRYMEVPHRSDAFPAFAITADYARGSSGAPIMNPEGQVVGIVRSTQSIYYSEKKGQQQNLQMVYKICIPVASLRKLIDTPL